MPRNLHYVQRSDIVDNLTQTKTGVLSDASLVSPKSAASPKSLDGLSIQDGAEGSIAGSSAPTSPEARSPTKKKSLFPGLPGRIQLGNPTPNRRSGSTSSGFFSGFRKPTSPISQQIPVDILGSEEPETQDFSDSILSSEPVVSEAGEDPTSEEKKEEAVLLDPPSDRRESFYAEAAQSSEEKSQMPEEQTTPEPKRSSWWNHLLGYITSIGNVIWSFFAALGRLFLGDHSTPPARTPQAPHLSTSTLRGGNVSRIEPIAETKDPQQRPVRTLKV